MTKEEMESGIAEISKQLLQPKLSNIERQCLHLDRKELREALAKFTNQETAK